MARLDRSLDLLNALCNAWNLPQHVRRLALDIPCEGITTALVELVQPDEEGQVQKIVGTFELVPIAPVAPTVREQLEALADLWDRPVPHVLAVLIRRGLRDAQAFGVCRECGCTEFDACDDEERGPCSWEGDDLCSACAEKLGELPGRPPWPDDELTEEQS